MTWKGLIQLVMENPVTFALMTMGRQSDRRSVIKVKKSDHYIAIKPNVFSILSRALDTVARNFSFLLLHCAMPDSSVWEKYSSVSKQLWWKQVNYWSRYFTRLLFFVSFFPEESRAQFLIDSSERSVNVRIHQYFVSLSPVMCFRKRNFV